MGKTAFCTFHTLKPGAIAGKTSIGIELPNKIREMIFLKQLIESEKYKYSQASLPIILGKDIVEFKELFNFISTL